MFSERKLNQAQSLSKVFDYSALYEWFAGPHQRSMSYRELNRRSDGGDVGGGIVDAFGFASHGAGFHKSSYLPSSSSHHSRGYGGSSSQLQQQQQQHPYQQHPEVRESTRNI